MIPWDEDEDEDQTCGCSGRLWFCSIVFNVIPKIPTRFLPHFLRLKSLATCPCLRYPTLMIVAPFQHQHSARSLSPGAAVVPVARAHPSGNVAATEHEM